MTYLRLLLALAFVLLPVLAASLGWFDAFAFTGS